MLDARLEQHQRFPIILRHRRRKTRRNSKALAVTEYLKQRTQLPFLILKLLIIDIVVVDNRVHLTASS